MTPWSMSKTSYGDCVKIGRPRAETDTGRHRRRKPGSSFRHRLRHGHHHSRLRTAVRALGHRGPLVRSAGGGLHRLDPGVSGDVHHGDAGAGLLPLGIAQRRRAPRQLSGSRPEIRQPPRSERSDGCASSLVRCNVNCGCLGGIGGHAAAARLLAALQRGHAHHQRALQSRHQLEGIEPARAHYRTHPDGRARGRVGRPPHRPGRTRRACRGRSLLRNRRRSQTLGPVEVRDNKRHPSSPLGAARRRQHRATDLASARPSAVGGTRRDRAQDIRRRSRYAQVAGRDPARQTGVGEGIDRSAG